MEFSDEDDDSSRSTLGSGIYKRYSISIIRGKEFQLHYPISRKGNQTFETENSQVHFLILREE